MKPIIISILDNDLYKFTMQQVILRHFPDVRVRYQLFNRGGTSFPKGFDRLLSEQVKMMGNLRLTRQEGAYLRAGRLGEILRPTQIDWLMGFSPDPNEVTIQQTGGQLDVLVEGPGYSSVWWECPIMSSISELYFAETGIVPDMNYVRQTARNKAIFMSENGLPYAQFGLRRRFSGDVERAVDDELIRFPKQPGTGGLVGISNLSEAMRTGQLPIGTMAHELAMTFAAINGFQSANDTLLRVWLEEFDGDLGTVIPDTFTTEVFLRYFNKKYAGAFDGVRQDSGSPFKFTDMMIDHYLKMRIDPMTKTIIFSDSLAPELALEIARYCEGRIKYSFGIGTNLTNDVIAIDGSPVTPLNIVIKVIAAQRGPGWPWIPTVKLSDDPGKITGDPEVAYMAQRLLGIARR